MVNQSAAAVILVLSTIGIACGQGAENTVARFHTDFGTFDVELFDQVGPNGLAASAAPLTVENFLNYVCDRRYNGTFFHRSVRDWVLQGGGFRFISPRARPIPTFAPIQNEFDLARSNIEGTIAMAKLGGDPHSATSHYYFNLIDNSAKLNVTNGGYTVFGRVVEGWELIKEIEQLDIVNYSSTHGALGTTPVMPSYTAGDPISNDVLIELSIESISGQRICLTCYADCDRSTGYGVFDMQDFLCFQQRFVNSEPYACDCDTSTGQGVCDVFDFLCFQDAFVTSCP